MPINDALHHLSEAMRHLEEMQIKNMSRRFITVDELARILQLSDSQIRAMAVRGELPGARKIGGLWRFDLGKIEQWLEENG